MSTPGEMCAFEVELMPFMTFPRTSSTPGEMCTIVVEFMPPINFPRTSSTPGDICGVELGSRTVLFFPKCNPPSARVARLSCCAEDCDYIRPAWLAGSSVYARTVTGSLLFGSPPQTCTELSPRFLSSVD